MSWRGLVVVALAVSAGGAAGGGSGEAGGRDDRAELRKLERALRAPWPDARRRAVKKLAALGTPGAWQSVLGALEDDEPEVADEAQIVLAGVRDPRVLARLYGADGLRHRDEWVRLRVAEAFGRMAVEIDGELLARAIEPRDVAVARALAWSLERAVRAGRLGGARERIAKRLETCLGRQRDPRLRADALAAIAALAPELARAPLEDALDDRAPCVRAAALVLQVARGEPSAFAAARRLAADPSSAVRLAAVDAFEQSARLASVDALIDRLDHEATRRVRERLASALQRLSGLRYRDDARPWRRWREGLAADWAPTPRAMSEPGSERDAPHTRASLRAFGVRSERVAILVDFSGSLWAEREDGSTRKELIDVELRALLESLPETTSFALVPYATEPAPLCDGLVTAEPRTVRRLATDFEACRLRGKGNVWDAALLALEWPDVESLLIVTDGAPTGGQRWNLELLTDLLVFECRWRQVAIDSVLVDASPRLCKSWARLADETGGRSVAVDFAEPRPEDD